MDGYKNNLIWVFINLNKTLETNEKLQKHQRVVNTKLLISHLLITLEYFTFCQSNAKAYYTYYVVGYEINIIRIFMDLNKNISNA